MATPEALDPAVLENLRQLTPPGEPDVLGQVLQLFLDEMPKRIDSLASAWQRGDGPSLARAAHSLKGSSGNIGARQMFELCRQIDERAKAGDFNAARHLLDALGEERGRVEAEIRALLG